MSKNIIIKVAALGCLSIVLASCSDQSRAPKPEATAALKVPYPETTVKSETDNLKLVFTVTSDRRFRVSITNDGEEPIIIGQHPDYILIYHKDLQGVVKPVTFDLSLTDASMLYPFDTVLLRQHSTFTLELEPYNNMSGTTRSALLNKPGELYVVLSPIERGHFAPDFKLSDNLEKAFLKRKVQSASVSIPMKVESSERNDE